MSCRRRSGPRNPNASPWRDLDVDAVDGGELAEPFDELDVR